MATQTEAPTIDTSAPANGTPPQNAEILERLGRRYEAGFVTEIESDSLPPGQAPPAPYVQMVLPAPASATASPEEQAAHPGPAS